MKVLFVFFHGLGDHVLASPAIREYRKQHPDHVIGWAMLERFKNAGYLNPNIDEFFYTADAWNDFGSYQEGIEKVTEQAHRIALENDYDKVIVINHKSSDKHKIHRTADEMGVKVEDVRTKFYFPKNPYAALLPEKMNERIFWHEKTGVQAKDLTLDIVRRFGLSVDNAIIPDSHQPIYFWAHVMTQCKHIVVADSVYFHICCALGRKPDFAWFQRGKYTFERVKPLHMDVSDIVKFP